MKILNLGWIAKQGQINAGWYFKFSFLCEKLGQAALNAWDVLFKQKELVFHERIVLFAHEVKLLNEWINLFVSHFIDTPTTPLIWKPATSTNIKKKVLVLALFINIIGLTVSGVLYAKFVSSIINIKRHVLNLTNLPNFNSLSQKVSFDYLIELHSAWSARIP